MSDLVEAPALPMTAREAQTIAFADAFVHGDDDGKSVGNARAAAREAGMGDIDRSAARMIARRAEMNYAIRQAIAMRAVTVGMAIALQTLIEVARDSGASPADRTKAAAALGRLAMDIAPSELANPAPPGAAIAAAPDSGKIHAVASALAEALRSREGVTLSG